MGIPPSLQKGISVSADDRAGGKRWRDISKILYAYLRRDMTDFREEQERLYPSNYRSHVQRTIPFVYRVARELAGLYLRSPHRRWLFKRDEEAGDGREGDDLPEATTRLIDRVYRGADVNAGLRSAHEMMIATGNAPILVWPMPALGGVRLMVIPPHQCDVKLSDPLSDSELDVDTFWCRLPLGRSALDDVVIYGLAEITRTTATWVEGPPDVVGTGLWNEAGTNPLGEVPIVLVRRASPAPGEWWASAPEDLLDAQRAINHDFTDLGTIARLQGFAQGWVKGLSQEQVNQLELGPNTFAGLWGEDADIGYASPSPDLKGYTEQMQAFTRTVISANGLNPATLFKSSSVTGLGKIIELIDREVEKRRHVLEFERAENRIYRLIAAWVNEIRRVPGLMPSARVKIEYREQEMPADPLHAAQSQQMRISLGTSSPVREIARTEGLTIDEARDRLVENLAESALVSGGGGKTLNGAQIIAALQVAERVSLGALSREGAIAFLVEGLGMTSEAAALAVEGAKPAPDVVVLSGGGEVAA